MSGMLKLFRLCVWAQIYDWARYIEKALDPVLVFIRGTTSLFEVVERRFFENFGRTSKSVRYAVWLSFMARIVIVHILKWMRNWMQ